MKYNFTNSFCAKKCASFPLFVISVSWISRRTLTNLELIGMDQYRTSRADEINKEAKRDIVVVPNDPMWKHAFGNLDMMHEIRRVTFRDTGVTDQKHNFCNSKFDVSREITKVQALVHQYKYFKSHVSIKLS